MESSSNSLAEADQVKISDRHRKPSGTSPYQYGTAGFRMKADQLDPVMFTVGIVAALRSKKLEGKIIGVMVTASHNPEEDNGVKLVDPRGDMLEQAWEGYATALANSTSPEDLVHQIHRMVTALQIDISKPANVIYARDTRPSGPALVSALVDGFKAAPGGTTTYTDEGVLTTPILHYLVRCKNTQGTADAYGIPTEDGYYEKLSTAFKRLLKPRGSIDSQHAPEELLVDCANGVGFIATEKLANYLDGYIKLISVNTSIDKLGVLNKGCGADFVKTQQKLPPSMAPLMKPNQRACSLDGDADRLMYYYLDRNGTFRMLDGDKIAALVAGFFGELLQQAGISKEELDVGVVQTAYANGASTHYMSQRVPVQCVPTGVKHLHHAAEHYSIGVYFEANGHGTVLFSANALNVLKHHHANTPAQQTSLDNLNALTELINQTVGDALSDMLLVEVVLAYRGYGGAGWDSLYTDLPNRLVKVSVKDRGAFKTEDAERRLTAPQGLQGKLDSLIKKYEGGRAFVRASGTEDAVRVYAEATHRVEADELAFKVAGMVYDEVGGDPATRPKEFIHEAPNYDSVKQQIPAWYQHKLESSTTSILRMSKEGQTAAVTTPYRQIRARQPTSETIIVYQAYSAEIADAAVAQQRLDASDAFKVGRMTWVKPSFYWCMYRSGWSYKDPRQARILQITVSKEGFLTLLGEASPSSGPEMARGALVRYQWDPERNIRLERLPYRSLQLGISGEMVSRWINEWIVGIQDITEDVRRWKGYMDEDGKGGAGKVGKEIKNAWSEDVFDVSDELQTRLGMKESGGPVEEVITS